MADKIKIGNKLIFRNIDAMLAKADVVPLTKQCKWVIFSDLHMGDGGSTDDFRQNAGLFEHVTKQHYLRKNFRLILNGDVEELLRFPLEKIRDQWKNIYAVFDAFGKKNGLIKIAGNHDLELLVNANLQPQYNIQEALRFQYKDDFLNLFHGHQASKGFQRHSEFIGFTLKYFANPLRIKNYSVAHDSRKQYKIERRVYSYSSFNKNVSIIGHTHRPLFESMHKVERMKYKIEQLCREFATSEPTEEIKVMIKALKNELKKYARTKNFNPFDTYIYNSVFHVPCLFNSGCVIGKRGMTCLEIEGDKIRLVHWFDKNISGKYLHQGGYQPEQLNETDFYRMVINEESLDYIFTRIKFLA
jgi:UDP-2,3-diacylglucosamine pyrophosphatase LpxH